MYGEQLLAFVAVAMDTFGFDGIYLDESSYGATPLDYNPLHSDNHSAIINRDTFEVVQPVSFVPLIWQGLQGKLFDAVTKRGGALVANSYPVTRTMTDSSVRNNVVHFVETSSKGCVEQMYPRHTASASFLRFMLLLVTFVPPPPRPHYI